MVTDWQGERAGDGIPCRVREACKLYCLRTIVGKVQRLAKGLREMCPAAG